MYDYYLGGKDNFAADREAAEKVLANMPQVRAFARANRAFLGRAVRHLAERGVTQFLDIGIGLPGPGGTAEVALSVRPDACVVGVDNDPIVLAHARASGNAAGPAPATIVQADVRDPKAILAHPGVREVLDFERPIAVMLVALSAQAYEQSTARLAVRSAAEITGFLDGLELLEPGVVLLPRWRPDGEVPEDADSVWMYAGVAARGEDYE
jgi:hypothetical protein